MNCLIHTWDGCKCTRCGRVREEGHHYVITPGECEERCTICGEIARKPHAFVATPGKCEEKCERCGWVRSTHTYVNGVCTKCGEQDPDRVMDQCLKQLLAIFPRTQFSSSGHVVFNEQHEDEVRAIGEKLDKLGGMRCMRKVGEAFARELPIHARKLETMWDGIGYWMG